MKEGYAVPHSWGGFGTWREYLLIHLANAECDCRREHLPRMVVMLLTSKEATLKTQSHRLNA